MGVAGPGTVLAGAGDVDGARRAPPGETPLSEPVVTGSSPPKPPSPAGVGRTRPFPEAWSEFRRDLIRRLELLNREVDALVERSGQVSRRSRREYLELLHPLKQRAERLARRAERVDHEGPRAQERFRGEAEETWSDLKRHLVRIAIVFQQRHPAASVARQGRGPKR